MSGLPPSGLAVVPDISEPLPHHCRETGLVMTSAVCDEGCALLDQELESGLSCRLVEDFASIASLQPDWDAAVVQLGGPVYMTYGWVKTWWEFYGQGKELRVFLFSHQKELVALLPIYLETFALGPVRVRVARLVGASLPPKTFDPPVASDWAREVFSHVLTRLFADDRCDLLSLGPVSAAWPPGQHVRQACERIGALVSSAGYKNNGVQTRFELPATFDDYLQTLSSSERKGRTKRIRQLERNHQVTSEVISDPARMDRAFDDFVQQHAHQWRSVGRPGHFGAWPNAEAYNRALVKVQAQQGRVRFFRLLLDGEVVVSRYTFVLGGTIYSELPARKVGGPWDKLGIGGTSLMKFNESAIQAGFTAVDSGLGAYEHKAKMGGEQIPVGNWRVVRSGLSRWKVPIFLFVAKFVLTVCHKLWYRRILPRLPRCFERTQQLWWLRFDV